MVFYLVLGLSLATMIWGLSIVKLHIDMKTTNITSHKPIVVKCELSTGYIVQSLHKSLYLHVPGLSHVVHMRC